MVSAAFSRSGIVELALRRLLPLLKTEKSQVPVLTGAVTLLSALLGAGGVAVVAVLTLRAFGEWETIRAREQGRA